MSNVQLRFRSNFGVHPQCSGETLGASTTCPSPSHWSIKAACQVATSRTAG